MVRAIMQKGFTAASRLMDTIAMSSEVYPFTDEHGPGFVHLEVIPFDTKDRLFTIKRVETRPPQGNASSLLARFNGFLKTTETRTPVKRPTGAEIFMYVDVMEELKRFKNEMSRTKPPHTDPNP